MRKLFSILLSALMLISLLSLCVSAAGDVVTITKSGGSKKNYTSFEDAVAELADGDTLTFTADTSGDVAIDASSKTVVIDGDGRTLSGTVYILAEGGNITVKNLKLDASSATTDALTIVAASNDAHGTVKFDGVTITTASGKKGIVAGGNHKVTVSSSSIVAGSTALQHVDDNPIELTVEFTYIETSVGYCFYGRKNSTYTFDSCEFKKNGTSTYAAIQCGGAADGTGSVTTLNNCTVNSENKQCFSVLAYQTYIVNGGTYNAVNNFACIYAEGNGAHLKITDGTFTCTGVANSQYDCSVVAIGSKDGTALLEIGGGTFTYTGGEIAGSAVIAGYKYSGTTGTVKITGGTFKSNSTLPVIDTVSGSELTLEDATMVNEGSNTIPAYSIVKNDTRTDYPFDAGSKILYIGGGAAAVTTGSTVITTPQQTTASEGTSPSPAGTGDDTTPNPTTGDNAPLLKYVIIAVAVAAIAALTVGVIIPGSKKNRA
ncbi:MAG: hypothetical protein J6V48_09740 [Clostridia bacterium]|nr:hypothetical protein [Clostridia bacterium]